MQTRLVAVSLAAVGALALASFAPAPWAASTPKPGKVLFQKDLAGIPGKELLLTEVQVLPGGASAPHRHDANVLVYVLEGSLVMQVEGQEPVTIGPGETFYEGPDDVHLQSANASSTQPARFLAFLVKDKGRPVTRDVKSRL